jgi:membrane-associated phospholipid phosphatase
VPWAPYIALYQLTNRFPLRTPTELPLSALDRAIPFVPELLPVYLLYLPLFFCTVARSRSDAEVNRLLYGTYLQLFLSLPFFVLLPITMPRELFYGSESFGWADTFWRWFDGPNNCFPSLHACNSMLFVQFNWHRPHRLVWTAAGVAVIATTVLVKQHYIVDVVAGAGVYVLTRLFLARVRIAGLESPTTDMLGTVRPASTTNSY